MIIYTIYKIVNKINNKVYIGFTSKNPPNKRWITHLSQLNNPKYSKLALYKSIKKYGKEYFEFIIIYQSKDRDHSYLQKRVLTPEGTFDSLTLASKHYNKSRSWMTKNLKTKPNLFYII
jgi:hypothetical protein